MFLFFLHSFLILKIPIIGDFIKQLIVRDLQSNIKLIIMKKISYLFMLVAICLSTMSFTDNQPVEICLEDENLELFFEIDLSELEDLQGWSNWYTTDCLRGLDFKLRNDGYNQYADKYRWSITFRNRYTENIHFSYKAVAPNQENAIKASGKTTDRLHVNANNGERGSYYLVPSSNSIYVYVNRIRLGAKDWGSDYINCDK